MTHRMQWALVGVWLAGLVAICAAVALLDLPAVVNGLLIAVQIIATAVGTAWLYSNGASPMTRHRGTTSRPRRDVDPVAASLIGGILAFGVVILVGEAVGEIPPGIYWPLLGAELIQVALLAAWWTRPGRHTSSSPKTSPAAQPPDLSRS